MQSYPTITRMRLTPATSCIWSEVACWRRPTNAQNTGGLYFGLQSTGRHNFDYLWDRVASVIGYSYSVDKILMSIVYIILICAKLQMSVHLCSQICNHISGGGLFFFSCTLQ